MDFITKILSKKSKAAADKYEEIKALKRSLDQWFSAENTKPDSSKNDPSSSPEI